MEPTDLAAAVADASHRTEVTNAVNTLYSQVMAQIAIRRPICELSGRCCRFDEFGHRLYVTTMELAAFLRNLRVLPNFPSPGTPGEGQGGGGCPFQKSKLCSVHTIRPMGCRLFFCDPTSTDWQQEQYEQFHGELKRLHQTLAVPYYYMEWRAALTQLGLNPT